MAVHDQPHRSPVVRRPVLGRAHTAGRDHDLAVTSATGAYALAGLRLLTGFVFLWAFLDKTFGLGYATPSGRGWTDGGSPTKGFLSSVAVGPTESTFHAWAGAAWADWLFMLGLLGVGLALVAGVALWPAAVAGSLMMALMWVAEWPPARHLSDGSPSMSTNPFADYHLVYAVVLVALAATGAGATWGLGRLWARTPFVDTRHWLR
ncbi:hypothetical protein ACFTWN_05110 [Streptomyces sp. NPDC057092]|uniref:hypothetical protein n=1 Tax=Streptomyces sp. NPDC057092 TaxID=3346017 RepID=UPI003625763E